MNVEAYEPIALVAGRTYGHDYHEIDHATQEARIEMWRASERIDTARNPEAMATRVAKRAARGAVLYGRMWQCREEIDTCKRGHLWTPENTVKQKRGRKCRACDVLMHQLRRQNRSAV